MCLLLVQTGLKEIPKEYLENAHASHPDGLGVSYFKEGKLNLKKGLLKFEEFYEFYKNEAVGVPAILHARFGTSGLKNDENCHPFVINDKCHFAHNGCISGFSTKIKDKSDTYAFNELILKPIAEISKNKNKKWWRNRGLKWFIQEDIGKGNKFAFIDDTGKIEIYNENSGEWVDEEKTIWASNNSYKIIKKRYNPDDDFEDYSHYINPRREMGFHNHNGYHKSYGPHSQPNHTNPGAGTGLSTSVYPYKNSKAQSPGMFDDPEDHTDGAVFDITKIPEDELNEVDAYLEVLNKS